MKGKRSPRSKAENTPVLHYAVRLLSARPYSEKKLSEKLRDRGYISTDIEGAIDRLKEKNLLSDLSFAEDFIRARCQTHPRGRIALVQDLVSRGIPSSLAQETASRLVTDADEETMAQRLIESKSKQYFSLESDVRKRRIAGLLGRRGFRPQTVFGLIEKLDQILENTEGEANSDL